MRVVQLVPAVLSEPIPVFLEGALAMTMNGWRSSLNPADSRPLDR